MFIIENQPIIMLVATIIFAVVVYCLVKQKYSFMCRDTLQLIAVICMLVVALGDKTLFLIIQFGIIAMGLIARCKFGYVGYAMFRFISRIFLYGFVTALTIIIILKCENVYTAMAIWAYSAMGLAIIYSVVVLVAYFIKARKSEELFVISFLYPGTSLISQSKRVAEEIAALSMKDQHIQADVVNKMVQKHLLSLTRRLKKNHTYQCETNNIIFNAIAELEEREKLEILSYIMIHREATKRATTPFYRLYGHDYQFARKKDASLYEVIFKWTPKNI